MNHSRIDLAIKAFMACLFVALAWVIVHSMTEPNVDVGDKAPSFSITTDQGKTITPANFGGKVLVLNFWATWCEPCVQEVPSLNQFQREMADSGVVVLGVSIDKNPNLYKDFLKRFNVSFQTARDPEANVSAEYGTFKVPETYIIGRDGKVIQKVIGERNWTDPQLMSYIKSI